MTSSRRLPLKDTLPPAKTRCGAVSKGRVVTITIKPGGVRVCDDPGKAGRACSGCSNIPIKLKRS